MRVLNRIAVAIDIVVVVVVVAVLLLDLLLSLFNDDLEPGTKCDGF